MFMVCYLLTIVCGTSITTPIPIPGAILTLSFGENSMFAMKHPRLAFIIDL
jgi:hypothetical protein